MCNFLELFLLGYLDSLTALFLEWSISRLLFPFLFLMEDLAFSTD